MLEKSFSLLFYPKKPKNHSGGNVAIYLRITVNGKGKEMTTKQKCDPAKWNKYAQRVRGNSIQVKTINTSLDTIERQVHEARKLLVENGTAITAEALRNRLTGQTEKPRLLLELFQEHNEQMAKLTGKDYARGTVQRYETALSHTRDYIKHEYNLADIELSVLSHKFITGFEYYLKTERECGHNTTMKYIANMRKIVYRAMKNGLLNRDPFIGFCMKKKEVARDYLTDMEIKQLQEKTFTIERIGVVRDIFLFSCYTGLAYIDVFNLTPNHIVKGIDGNNWIHTQRQKTESPSRIPLLPQAQALLDLYKDHPKCLNEGKLLPTLSNQKMNAYLKEVADLCGINKQLTFHMARHTFATTVTLSNGVPIETVSKMLGHKNISMTQHYAKIIDKKVSEDMLQLQQKLYN